MCITKNKVKVIFNPNSHSGKSRGMFNEFLNILKSNGIDYLVYETQKPKDARRIAFEQVEDNDVVIIIGGDGTVHEIINGSINKKRIKYYILPAGTGNDIYSAVNHLKKEWSFEQIFMESNIKKCNTILINDNFIMTLFVAYGIVMDIIKECRKKKEKKKSSYLKAVIKVAFFYNPTEFEYSVNELPIKRVKADYIGVNNASRVGGGMLICPLSKINDDKIELVILEYKNRIRRILNIIAMLRQRIDKQPNYKCIVCDSASIFSTDSKECCIDGEILVEESITAELRKESIEFLI